MSNQEWYEHGQSGKAALALAAQGLVIYRPASGGVGNYIAPAIKITDAGRAAVANVGEPIISEAIRMLEVKQARETK